MKQRGDDALHTYINLKHVYSILKIPHTIRLSVDKGTANYSCAKADSVLLLLLRPTMLSMYSLGAPLLRPLALLLLLRK